VKVSADQRSGKVDCGGKRHHPAQFLHQVGEGGQREEHSAEKEHGGYEQTEVVIEAVDRGNDGGEEQGDGGEHEPLEKTDERYQKCIGRVYQTEDRGYNQHGNAGERSPGRPPKDLAGGDIFYIQRCGYDGIECPLVLQAHKAAICAFEVGAKHGISRYEPRSDELDVLLPVNQSNISTQPQPHSEQDYHWFCHKCRGLGMPQPEKHVPVALPYSDKTA